MPQTNRHILLASAREDLPQLLEPLREQGFEVELCRDGAGALQLSLARFPVLMLVDTDIPLLPAERLAQILRSNPRMERMGFFFIGREGEEVEGFRPHRDQFVPRPFNSEQLLNAVQGQILRRERTEQAGRGERNMTGRLEQISLADLLQVFGLNRKDGVLNLQRGEERAAVHLLGGNVINARSGGAGGEKAFFRLLTWTAGEFRFVPGPPGIDAEIARPLDHLLMEGMRQNDELAAQREDLPGPDILLSLKVTRERLPRGLRPTTQEVLMLLEYYPRVRDLLDHCRQTDLEILQVLKVLLEKGLITEVREIPATERGPLLRSREILAAKDCFNEADTLLEEATAKLVLLATGPRPLQQFVQALQGCPEFQPEGDVLPTDSALGLGDVGRLMVGETFALRLFSLPATADTAPLWRSFGRQVFGVVALEGDDALAEAIGFFEGSLHIPVARVAPGDAPAPGRFRLRAGDRASLRRLLAFFASRFTGDPVPEEET